MRKSGYRWFFSSGLILVCLMSLTVYAAPQTQIRFMWWGGESRHKATLAAIAVYMKENPKVRITGEYGGFSGYQQKLLTQLAGGTAADIIQIDQPWLADLVSQGDLFVDLYKLKGLNLAGFDQAFLKTQCEWDKKLVGLPTGLNGLIYIANVDFLKTHQIDLKTQWDWDKLLEVGGRINRTDKNSHLLTMDLTHTQHMIKMYVKQHHGIAQWVNDDFTLGFDKTMLSQAFTYYQKLLQSGAVPGLDETILFNGKTEQNPKWGSGQIGIAQNWVSANPIFYLNGKLTLDVMLPPVMKGAKTSGIVVRPAQLIVINKRSGNLGEVAKFVNWFFNNEAAWLALGTERGIPPTQAGLKTLEDHKLIDPNMAKGINLSLKNAGQPENALTTNKELITIFDEAIQKVGFGKATPEEAAEQMVRAYQKKLSELKRQN